MATMGYFDKQTHDTSVLFFRLLSDKLSGFTVTGFKEGIVDITVSPSYDIEDVLDAVMGCFETCSNFKNEVLKVYNCDTNTVFKGIRVEHCDMFFVVTASTINKDGILAKYWKDRYYNSL